MEAAIKLGAETMRHRSILGAGKTGSISRKQARSAALAAKTTQTASSREAPTSTWKGKRLPQTSSAVWERFLGQFGDTGSRKVTRSSSASMPARVKETASAAKKTAAKKMGTKE